MKKFGAVIKTLLVNTLATTALSLLLMTLIAVGRGFTLMGLAVPWQILLVNLLAHGGFRLLACLNLRYPWVNYLLMLGYLIGIIIGFGFLFHWFTVNAVGVVCVVGVVVFAVAFVIDLIKINHDAQTINAHLTALRERHDAAAEPTPPPVL